MATFDKDRLSGSYRNKKTGGIYFIIEDQAVHCTNGHEEEQLVVYCKEGTVHPWFVREYGEFIEKFEEIDELND